MSVVLGVIAIVVLLVLIVASVKMRHETRAAESREADVRAHTGEAQHADSLRRRANVRAEQPAGTITSPADE
jgi:predicted Holliday junction resolvase-like endonuclease